MTYHRITRYISFDTTQDVEMPIMLKAMEAIYHYKLAYSGDYLDYEDQFTVAWNSDELNIEWPCNNPILSRRDNK